MNNNNLICMEIPCVICRKSYVDKKTGEVREYMSISIKAYGVDIPLSPKDDNMVSKQILANLYNEYIKQKGASKS